jgi:hypothetical protein
MDNWAIGFPKISLKFFPKLSSIRTVVPCRPDGRTSAASNFRIKASSVRTKGMVVRTVDLMHAISISDARTSGRLDFECDTCLMDECVRTVAANFPYLCFGRKSHSWSNTEYCLDVLLKRPDGCTLEQFEASQHRGRRAFRR